AALRLVLPARVPGRLRALVRRRRRSGGRGGVSIVAARIRAAVRRAARRRSARAEAACALHPRHRRHRQHGRGRTSAGRRRRADVERRLRRHSPEAAGGAGSVTGVRLVPSEGEGDPGAGIRILDAGDSALLLELEAMIDPAVNARAIAIAAAVAAEGRAGVRDVIPTYRSVAVHFDPLVADVDGLRGALRRAANSAAAAKDGALVEVPVAYGGEHGPDLDEVAAFAKLSPAAVIERYCATEYRVFMLGFLPGFAYMGSVDDSIAAPRKATPRTRIPQGSVGIAGRQTGIYPRQSPGGWQLIGRTGVPVFDPLRSPASLFAPGDRVRFVPEPRTPEPRISNHRTLEPRTLEPRTTGSRLPAPDSRYVT